MDKLTLIVQELAAGQSPTGFVIQGFAYKDQTAGSPGGTTWGNIESMSYTKLKDSSALLVFIQASLIASGGAQELVTGSIGARVDSSADLALANATINGFNGTAWEGRHSSLACMRLFQGVPAGERTINIRGIVNAGTFNASESQIYLMEIG